MENFKIKIGRREYVTKKGDYIMYNGCCYQFCAGDGRTLKFDGYDRYSSLTLSQRAIKTIPFDSLTKKTEKRTMEVTCWYF